MDKRKRTQSVMNGGLIIDLDYLQRKLDRENKKIKHNAENKQQIL